MPNLHRFYPWLFLCVWSAGYSMAKLALEYTEPLNLLAFRFTGALIALTPILFLMRLPMPNTPQVRALMGTGLFLHLGHFGSIYVGMKLGASSNIMALFAASQPVLIVLSAAMLARKIPSWQVWVGLCMGLSGAAWVIGVDMDGNTSYVLGAFLGFTAVVGLSIGQVIEKQRKIGVHPIMATWVQYFFAASVSIPIALYLEGLSYQMSWQLIGSVSYLALGNSIVGILLMFSMVRRGSMSQVSSIMFLVPAMAALIAWPVVGEVVPLLAIPGILLAMAGAIWTRRFA